MSRDNTATVVVVGGGLAALLWLLVRGGLGASDGGWVPGGGNTWGLGRSPSAGGGGVGGERRRCSLRLSAQGLTLDGASVTADQAAERCTESDLVVTGDARQGDLDRLRAVFAARGRRLNEKLPGASGAALLVPASMRGPRRW